MSVWEPTGIDVDAHGNPTYARGQLQKRFQKIADNFIPVGDSHGKLTAGAVQAHLDTKMKNFRKFLANAASGKRDQHGGSGAHDMDRLNSIERMLQTLCEQEDSYKAFFDDQRQAQVNSLSLKKQAGDLCRQAAQGMSEVKSSKRVKREEEKEREHSEFENEDYDFERRPRVRAKKEHKKQALIEPFVAALETNMKAQQQLEAAMLAFMTHSQAQTAAMMKQADEENKRYSEQAAEERKMQAENQKTTLQFQSILLQIANRLLDKQAQ